MGYTHYFNRIVNTGTGAQFFELAMDAQRIIAEAERQGIRIGDWKGEGSPEFTEGYFSLNGFGPESCETFAWTGTATLSEWEDPEAGTVFGCTKTNYRPYDAVVTAILIRAKVVYGPDVWVSSDGDWEDWQAGRALYRATFGEDAPYAFTALQ